MKKLGQVVVELREQIEEATDRKDPTKLSNYTKCLRDNMVSIIPMLSQDPTMAALAFHGQLKFNDRRSLTKLSQKNGSLKASDWETVKKSILVRQEAHDAVKVLVDANLFGVLVVAVVANFAIHNQSVVQQAMQEIEDEHGQEQDE